MLILEQVTKRNRLFQKIKIKLIEFFAKLYMAFWFECKFAWNSNFLYFEVFCVEFSDWSVRMAHIRKTGFWRYVCGAEGFVCFVPGGDSKNGGL